MSHTSKNWALACYHKETLHRSYKDQLNIDESASRIVKEIFRWSVSYKMFEIFRLSTVFYKLQSYQSNLRPVSIFSTSGPIHFSKKGVPILSSPEPSTGELERVVALVNKTVKDDKQFPFPASRHSAWIWSKIEINAKISSLLSSSANFVLNKRQYFTTQ